MPNLKRKLPKEQEGISLLLAILIMSILLAMGLGISTIFFQEIRMVRGIGNSVVAFYAADTGIEIVLRELSAPSPIPITCFLPPNNNICYQVYVYASGNPECPATTADTFCIKSVGSYLGTKRAIEVTY